MKWARKEGACVQTGVCVFECAVSIHTHKPVGIHEMCGACLQACVYVYIKYI